MVAGSRMSDWQRLESVIPSGLSTNAGIGNMIALDAGAERGAGRRQGRRKRGAVTGKAGKQGVERGMRPLSRSRSHAGTGTILRRDSTESRLLRLDYEVGGLDQMEGKNPGGGTSLFGASSAFGIVPSGCPGFHYRRNVLPESQDSSVQGASRASNARLLYDNANPDTTTAPGMPRVQDRAGAGPMGGLALSCTMRPARTAAWDIGRRPGDNRLAKLAARLRSAPPTSQLGR